MKKDPRGFVEVKCVSCGRLGKVYPHEIPEGEHPVCDLCYSPMLPVKAKVRRWIEDE